MNVLVTVQDVKVETVTTVLVKIVAVLIVAVNFKYIIIGF